MGHEQPFDAKILYLTAYELVKYIDGSSPMHACLALESLAQVEAIEGEINAAINHLDTLMNVLRNDYENAKKEEAKKIDTKNIDIHSDDEDDKRRKNKDFDHKIKLLNVRAYYSCILSLHCYQHRHHEDIGFKLNRSFEMYEELLKECRDKYGDTHYVTFAIYLYFGLHFVNVEKFDYAFTHIEYIKNHTDFKQNNRDRELSFDEKKLFHQLLTAFINKLLMIGDVDKDHHDLGIFNSNELKQNCLKIFEYQLLSTDDVNHDITEINNKKKQLQIQKENNTNNHNNKQTKSKPKIKKEPNTNDDDCGDKSDDELIKKLQATNCDKIIDKNDILINQHIKLLLYKFQDFNRVQGIISNFEQNQVTLTDVQIKQFDEIKQELKFMQENVANININNNHNIDLHDGHSKHSNGSMLSPKGFNRYDFNTIPNMSNMPNMGNIPNFLPPAPGSD